MKVNINSLLLPCIWLFFFFFVNVLNAVQIHSINAFTCKRCVFLLDLMIKKYFFSSYKLFDRMLFETVVLDNLKQSSNAKCGEVCFLHKDAYQFLLMCYASKFIIVTFVGSLSPFCNKAMYSMREEREREEGETKEKDVHKP